MRNPLRTQGIEAPRGACDGGSKDWHGSVGVPPTPGVYVSADSKEVTGVVSVSADSKELIFTKIVQNARFYGSEESKGVTGGRWRVCSR